MMLVLSKINVTKWLSNTKGLLLAIACFAKRFVLRIVQGWKNKKSLNLSRDFLNWQQGYGQDPD